MEYLIYEQAVANKKKRRMPKDKEFFDFYAPLYIKYIETYKKLEDVYDQIQHPQKRQALLEVLKNTLARLLELKKDLIEFNTFTNAKNSIFVNLDELFFDLKILPDKLEVPIPRFAKEIGHKNLSIRDQLIEKYIYQYHDQELPEEEELVYRDFEKLTEETAMHCILINERGRQGIVRALAKKSEKKGSKGKRAQRKDNEKGEISMTIQKYYRAFVDRKMIWEARREEMKFLGMLPEDDEVMDELDREVRKIRRQRKDEQEQNENQLKDQSKEIKENLQKTESPDIKEHMLYERRNWITEYYEDHEGKELPDEVEKFYERFNVGPRLSPEEEELKKKLEAEKKKAAKKAKAKKGKKKMTEKEEFLATRVPKGPENSEVLKAIKTDIEKFTGNWARKDESDNFEQKMDRKLIRERLMPEIEKNIEQEVDEIIKCELKNLYLKLGIKKKKKKKKRGKKKKKKNKNKGKGDKRGKKIPGAKAVGKRAPPDLLGDTAKFGILKRLKPAKLSDFKGDYNLLRTIQEAQAPSQPDPSLAQLRNAIAELVGIPLGVGFTEKNKNRTYLFYGPQGTGKSLMVRALAAECRCMVLDISPYVVADNFKEKKRITEMMYTVFKVAIEYQPAIILIDECEHYFPSKKASKKGKRGPQAGTCKKMKKDLMKQVKKHLLPTDRIAIIACTNRPYLLNTKEVTKFFTQKFYFPYPDYSSRISLFKHLVKENGIKLTETFPLSQFSLMTEGYTAGSVRPLFKILKGSRAVGRLSSVFETYFLAVFSPFLIELFVDFLQLFKIFFSSRRRLRGL